MSPLVKAPGLPPCTRNLLQRLTLMVNIISVSRPVSCPAALAIMQRILLVLLIFLCLAGCGIKSSHVAEANRSASRAQAIGGAILLGYTNENGGRLPPYSGWQRAITPYVPRDLVAHIQEYSYSQI